MAHRGGGGLWPQNTLYAFERAAALGVDVLEMDIHASRDGVLVVMHDEVVDYNTQGQGRIKDLALAELKALDAGYRWTNDGGATYPYRGLGIRIPTLEEVLQAFPVMRLNIDIKQVEPPIVEPFVEMLRRYGKSEQVMVGSFHEEPLRRFRALCPEAATAGGVGETRLFWGLSRAYLDFAYRPRANAFQVPEWSGSLHVVTPCFIRAAHARGIEVHVWTVDDEADIRRLIKWGVDGIITDRPDRLMHVLNRKLV